MLGLTALAVIGLVLISGCTSTDTTTPLPNGTPLDPMETAVGTPIPVPVQEVVIPPVVAEPPVVPPVVVPPVVAELPVIDTNTTIPAANVTA